MYYLQNLASLCYNITMNIKNLYKEKDNTEFEKNVLHKADGEISDTSTELLVEHYTTLYINDIEVATLVCTGTSIVELAIGRIISEGILKDVNDIDNIYICEKASRARVYLKEGVNFTNNVNKSVDVASCCQDNKSYFKSTILPDKLKNTLEIKDKDVFSLAEAFAIDSKIHKMTSGTHAAYLYKDGKVIVSFEDIGRHNALDKVIGYMYINGIKPEECMVFTTGRVPVDMVRKAIYARLGALVSKAVPTVDAVALAKEYNLNLICRAWQDSFQVFNKSEVASYE